MLCVINCYISFITHSAHSFVYFTIHVFHIFIFSFCLAHRQFYFTPPLRTVFFTLPQIALLSCIITFSHLFVTFLPVHCFVLLHFQARSQNPEKRLLASSCPSVRPSAWNISTPTGRISWNLIFEYFSKMRRENSSFTKIGQDTSVSYPAFFLLRMRNVSVKKLEKITYYV